MRTSEVSVIDPWTAAIANPEARDPTLHLGVLAIGAAIELCGAAAACALSLLGLAGRSPDRMAARAAVVLGCALVIHATSVLAVWRAVARHLDTLRYDCQAVAIALALEAIAGVAAVVLGGLAIARPVAVGVGLPVAAVALAIATWFGGAAQPQLGGLTIYPATWVQRLAAGILVRSDGMLVLAGTAAINLGVLAAVGIGPTLTLTLVAYLAIATTALLAGGALTARLAAHARARRLRAA